MKTEREKFIDKNRYLFWYMPKNKLHQMSDEVLVEFILNYADLPQIFKLFKIVGKKKVAGYIQKNLKKVKNKQRQNYSLPALNLFQKFFEAENLLKHS